MLNNFSIDAVNRSTFRETLRKPLYESYCFSKIPDTIKKLLGIKSLNPLPGDCIKKNEVYDDVILFFIDGFGWVFLEKNQESQPFLQRIIEKGIVSKITSQFPSTTACHVTTMNTGLPVSETGIYEWFYYEPKLDDVIVPFLFSFAGDKNSGSIEKTGIPPEEIYPFATFYEDLEKQGVESYVLEDEHIVDSIYSKTLLRGAKSISFRNLEDALQKLSNLLLEPSSKKRYFYIYIEDIDSAGHRNGTYSSEFQNSINYVFTHLESWVLRIQNKLQRKTAYLLTADHGMIDIDPKTTVYLNEEFPKCKEFIQKNRQGKLLAPAGSSRDFFLHVQPELLTKAKSELQEFLGDKAIVCETKELLDNSVFGVTPSLRLLERLGNLVLLPKDHNSIWWHEKNRFAQHFYAMHGGLSKQEMETIFLFFSMN